MFGKQYELVVLGGDHCHRLLALPARSTLICVLYELQLQRRPISRLDFVASMYGFVLDVVQDIVLSYRPHHPPIHALYLVLLDMLKVFMAAIDHRIALRVPDYGVEAKHLDYHFNRDPTMLRFKLSEILL